MQKKHASLLSIIFLSVFVVISFMPVVFTMSYWENKAPGVGIAGKDWSVNVSMFSRNIWLSLIILICAIVGVVALTMHYADKDSGFLKYGSYAPIATAALFALYSLINMFSTVPNGEPGGTASWGYYGYYEYTPAWGFFIECALLIVVCVMTILIVKGKVVNAEPKQISEVNSNNIADELKKFKELLDSGAITQEEYDEKKRKLLDL